MAAVLVGTAPACHSASINTASVCVSGRTPEASSLPYSW
jgi:hypothetical protein